MWPHVCTSHPLALSLFGLGISILILRITWQSWQTVHAGHTHPH